MALWAGLSLAFPKMDKHTKDEEKSAFEFVTKAEAEIEMLTQEYYKLAWAYNTNITDHNQMKQLEQKVNWHWQSWI